MKRKIMINDYCCDRRKMIDSFSFNKSLKLTWIKKYLEPYNNGTWKPVMDDIDSN